MNFQTATNYYEILELTERASPQEIRSAYLRAKAAYTKDSPALYSLISREEADSLLDQIEEAYQILSNTERRKEYDEQNSLGSGGHPTPAQPHRIVSIDRMPPMEAMGNEADILIPPTTDFQNDLRLPSKERGFEFAPPASTQLAPAPLAPAPTAPLTETSKEPALTPREIEEQQICLEIAAETEWRGSFLGKVRKSRHIAIEEMTGLTRINRGYLNAIELDDYAKLPASVFVRGFIAQLARTLKLPAEKAVSGFMGHFQKWILENPNKGR